MLKRILAYCLAAVLLSGCSAPVSQAPVTQSATAPVPETSIETTAAQDASFTKSPETQPALVLHSGIREDGTFTEGTLFMGDSLTYTFVSTYLEAQGLLGDAHCAARCGSKVTQFFDENITLTSTKNAASKYDPAFANLTFAQAAEVLGESATAIYFMWGTNYIKDGTSLDYTEIIRYLLDVCPNATIHMQTIPKGNLPYSKVNQRIQEAYDYFMELGEDRLFLVDTFTAIGQATATDGIHLFEKGNIRWYEALLAHAQANSLKP